MGNLPPKQGRGTHQGDDHGGWKDLKTMQIYVRKADVEIKGATDCLNLHSGSPTKQPK